MAMTIYEPGGVFSRKKLNWVNFTRLSYYCLHIFCAFLYDKIGLFIIWDVTGSRALYVVATAGSATNFAHSLTPPPPNPVEYRTILEHSIVNFFFSCTTKNLFLFTWISVVKKRKTERVPDRRSRVLEVVIVRRLISGVLGIWKGERLGRGWEKGVSLQATWDQGGRILSHLGGFPSK